MSYNFGDSQRASLEVFKVAIQQLAPGEFDAVHKTYLDSRLASLKTEILGADVSPLLDTLKEIQTYLETNNLSGALLTQITALSASLATETAERKSADAEEKKAREDADANLQTQITQVESDASARLELLEQTVLTGTNEGEADLVTRVVDIEGVLAGDLKLTSDGEIYPTVAAALLAEHQSMTDTNSVTFNALANKIQTKLGYDSPAENFVLDAGGFTGAYQDVNLFVNGAISQEAKSREDADVGLDGKIDEEKSARVSADVALGSRVDTEVSERKTADAAISASVVAETARAVSAEDRYYAGAGFDIADGTKALYFSSRWKLAGSVDGKRLIFSYNRAEAGQPEDFVVAVPFISAE